MSRVHCRCRACGTRQTLKKEPRFYVIKPKCRMCGRREYTPRNMGKNVMCSPIMALKVDPWANKRRWRKHTCYCDGYHYPHREGSRWCYENVMYGLAKEDQWIRPR